MDKPEEKKNEIEESRKRRSRIFALVLFAVYLAAMAVAVIAFDGRHVRFYMRGTPDMELPLGEEYREPGCTAVSAGRVFGERKKPLDLTITGQVDGQTPGTYELSYSARLLLGEYRTVRTVRVVDKTPPEITIYAVEGYVPNWLDGYEEEGYRAVDNWDGDLSDRVVRRVLDDRVEYTVTDTAGNTAAVARLLNYSVGKPQILLNGEQTLSLGASLSYTDPGFQAYDAQGHNLTGYVQVNGQVIPYETGTYTVEYSITNGKGERASAVRTVEITPIRNPDIVTPNVPTIYLTFDDGPGPYTSRLLDVLLKYNVKATFFVTCLEPDYEDMVGRAYREGNSIGVHSASHDYYEVYASEEAFFEDFNRVQEMILRQTGTTTRIFRFPGGSSNTVSRFNRGIMTRLTRDMTDMGYQYFDWSVTSGDAGETTDTDTIFRNIVNGCAGEQTSIVLQHDNKDFSVAAVERVILWGLNNGYVFRPLDISSPTVQHKLAN